jgi:CheY-like chemotaxis protein
MEAIGTLAGGIAHDFNNILSAIIGYTELALDDKVQGFKQKDILNEVLIASNRAKDLVHQILAFARQSDEKLKPVLVRIIAKEVLKLIRSSIPTTIEIRQKINSNALIMGTPTQIHQIMMNLCTNAAHAMGKTGGTLSVDLLEINIANSHCSMNLPQGNYLELSVTDTGCGIAPNIITTVFDPYFTTKNLGEGTGMGLSVVQGIVEKYGGRITVESQLDKGSTFRVYLPIHEATAEAIQPSKIRLPACHERILIVDDEIAIVKISCLILEQLGYRVTPQTSSIEALRLFRKAPGDFDLVITDMTMPNMTGDQMAEQMLHIRHDLPVILCTGYSKHTNEEMALKIGIRAFIYKPIKKNDLAAIVRKVLDENTVVAERRHGYMKAEGQKNQQSGTFFSGSNVSEIIFK